MFLGSHVSCQGGFAKAVDRAQDLGCECLQIFVSNPPRQWPVFIPKNEKQEQDSTPVVGRARATGDDSPTWHAKPLAEDAVAAWCNAMESSELSHPIAHASYLINLGSPRDDLFDKSIHGLIIEWQRANQLGLEGLVVHPGSYTDSSAEIGLDRIIDGVAEVIDHVEPGSCRLLLENTAGQGTCLGHDLNQLAYLLDGIDNFERVGICFDTCHAFAAGYDISQSAGFRDTRQVIDDLFPDNTIAAIHLNDSKKPLGSRVDRHEHIGRGEIGLNGFRYLLEDEVMGQLPGYLETEKGTDEESGEDWDVINLRTLRELTR